MLPPLLYAEAFQTSWAEFRANLRMVTLLAVGLVIATTVIVAALVHWVIGLSWPVAFVLGAVVAPTDEAATAPVFERLRVPRRIVTVVSDESLVNDAVSLVIYRMAAAAVVGESISLGEAGLQLVLVSAGGVAVGMAVGWLMARLLERIEDAPVEITLSLLTPFMAYLPAEAIGASGVLAVVALGVYLGRQAPRMRTAGTRVRASAFWGVLVFLLNGVLFVLVGLQLRAILAALSLPFGTLALYGGFVSLVCVLARFAWVFPAVYLPRAVSSRLRRRDPAPPWSHAVLVGWGGIRGGLSLTAALAIPFVTRSGAPFPHRSLIIFLTFSVILITLVVQGLTLPALIRVLKIRTDSSPVREENKARLAIARAALARLEKLTAAGDVPPRLGEFLREEHEYRARRFSDLLRNDTGDPHEVPAEVYQRVQHALVTAERETLIGLRDRGEITDETFRSVERLLDFAELRIVPEEG
jgi:CPA1 family monovalent cation:H+ antiporter